MNERIDVLAVMDRAAGGLLPYSQALSAETLEARTAVAELILIADRIYRADASGNNGAVMGEASLCPSFANQLRAALARVGGAK